MVTIDNELIARVTDTIVRRLRPKRVVLFGSRARGDARPDSDLDLFVEMETTRRPPDRAIEVSSLFGLRPWPLDVIVYTPEEVQRLRADRNSLVAVIEREGRLLYERP